MLADPYAELCARIDGLLAARAGERPVIVALDGGCGCGKTTLAENLARRFAASVTLHMDDYYLPPERRPAGWQHTPGANMDLARLRAEALEPLRAGCVGRQQAYCCGAGAYRAAGPLEPQPLVLVEGSYSCHPSLADLYDLRVFVACAPAEQERRLREREGERFGVFAALWAPLERAYFEQYHIEQTADIVLDTAAL